MSSPTFLDGVVNNIIYWHSFAQGGELTNSKILQVERKNLYQAVQIGLMFVETQAAATALALDLYEFIEVNAHGQEWIPILKLALKHTVTSSEMYGRLLNQLGFLHMLDRQLEESTQYHRAAEKWAIANSQRLQLANAFMGLSLTHLYAHHYEEAKTYGEQALQGFIAAGVNPKKVASTYNTLAQITHTMGDYVQAEHYYLLALKYRKEAGGNIIYANILNNLSYNHRIQNKFREAEECLHAALRIIDRENNPTSKVYSQNALGILYFVQGRYPEAERAFQSMDTAFLRRTGQLALLGHQANNLGNVALKQKEYPKAQIYLNQAVEIWRRITNELNLANTLGDLAETLFYLNRPNEGILFYEEACELLSRYPQNQWAVNRLTKIKALQQE